MKIIEMAYKDIADYKGSRYSYRLEQLWNDLLDGLPKNIKNEVMEVTKGIAVPYELTFATEHDDKHNVNSIPFKFSINRNIKYYIVEQLQTYLDNLLIIAKWE